MTALIRLFIRVCLFRNGPEDMPYAPPLLGMLLFVFFFNDTATTEIYTNLNTLSLHDALPICLNSSHIQKSRMPSSACDWSSDRSEEHTSELPSHSEISYAVFCLKKKKNTDNPHQEQRGQIAEDDHPPRVAPHLYPGHGRPQARRSVPALPYPVFFNDTATTEIYTKLNSLSLHDALPISTVPIASGSTSSQPCWSPRSPDLGTKSRSEEHTSELQSHSEISYAVFCLKKKTTTCRNKRRNAPPRRRCGLRG